MRCAPRPAAPAGARPTLPKNSGIGIACVSSQERATATWTACAATVEVNPANGAFEVKKLTVAMDLGTVVNPDGVKAQIEGSTLWGMSLALFEKAPLKDGALQVSNFGDYTPLRMSEMPDLDISIIANNDPPSGCGEPAVTVVAPAIANAIFNACGVRVRSLPITAGGGAGRVEGERVEAESGDAKGGREAALFAFEVPIARSHGPSPSMAHDVLRRTLALDPVGPDEGRPLRLQPGAMQDREPLPEPGRTRRARWPTDPARRERSCSDGLGSP